ncbi:hypothetical protein EP7_001684 [Isosphaeraceae bacterium EP7]
MVHEFPESDAARLDDERGFLSALVGDGRPLLTLTGLALTLSGLVALFLAATGHFLPHDERYLGMTSADLCSLHACRIVHFMIHDRVSFGGALVAIGLLYLWMAEFPLKRGEPWAWWLFLLSGAEGFVSFFAYLGYGYLDTWHGIATLGLLPCFAVGLALSRETLNGPSGIRSLLSPSVRLPWLSIAGLGRACLLATALGLVGGGLTILVVGMTTVFVPQDLVFLDIGVDEFNAINGRLIPLIAHDRAGFGGAVCCFGITLLCVVWCARPSKSLWQALALAGTIGSATAIGVHPVIGYNDAVHLAPAVLGACVYAIGLLAYRPACHGGGRPVGQSGSIFEGVEPARIETGMTGT